MTILAADRAAHWDEVSSGKPELSLKLIGRVAPSRAASIIDIDDGASSLADCLLARGYTHISALGIAAAALAPRTFDIWHDHAVLRALTRPDEQRAYADALRRATLAESWIIIGAFAASGARDVGHDAASLCTLLGPSFSLLETHGEIQRTSSGHEQTFRYYLFQRRAPVSGSRPCAGG